MECFVGCLVECFVGCLVECFVRCRPLGYRETFPCFTFLYSFPGSWAEHVDLRASPGVPGPSRAPDDRMLDISSVWAGTTCFHVSRPPRGVSKIVVPSWNPVLLRVQAIQGGNLTWVPALEPCVFPGKGLGPGFSFSFVNPSGPYGCRAGGIILR